MQNETSNEWEDAIVLLLNSTFIGNVKVENDLVVTIGTDLDCAKIIIYRYRHPTVQIRRNH